MTLKAGPGGGGWPPADLRIRQLIYGLRGKAEAYSRRFLMCLFQTIFTCTEEELPPAPQPKYPTSHDFAQVWREHLDKDGRWARNCLYAKIADKMVRNLDFSMVVARYR